MKKLDINDFFQKKWRKKNPGSRFGFTSKLKVSKSRKQFMVSWILIKSERKNSTTMIPQVKLFSFLFWENWGDHKLLSRFTRSYLPPVWFYFILGGKNHWHLTPCIFVTYFLAYSWSESENKHLYLSLIYWILMSMPQYRFFEYVQSNYGHNVRQINKGVLYCLL